MRSFSLSVNGWKRRSKYWCTPYNANTTPVLGNIFAGDLSCLNTSAPLNTMSSSTLILKLRLVSSKFVPILWFLYLTSSWDSFYSRYSISKCTQNKKAFHTWHYSIQLAPSKFTDRFDRLNHHLAHFDCWCRSHAKQHWTNHFCVFDLCEKFPVA